MRTLLHRAEKLVSKEDDKKNDIDVQTALETNNYESWALDTPAMKDKPHNEPATSQAQWSIELITLAVWSAITPFDSRFQN